MVRLSKRLQRVAGQVQNGGVVADIGCDHGYTAIYLIEQGLAERVIAMDINRAPLQRAADHIRQYQMEERIEIRLSDGAAELLPGEADALLISGMGGALICQILAEAVEVTARAQELILSPQSELSLVRHYLLEHGFCIDREEMFTDRGKYYTVIHAVHARYGHGKQQFEQEEEYIYGKYLLDHHDLCLLTFLNKEKSRLERVLNQMRESELSEEGKKQKLDVERKLCCVLRAISFCS